ncbi:hypothetical protein AB1Y20_016480 [Prymnesium parvum]|uniref:Ubiquitin-like domain-containing protein n=1 Tax=Prymnesium parvum TaxID=97485 RepID=A0AB34IFD2_PRYPA
MGAAASLPPLPVLAPLPVIVPPAAPPSPARDGTPAAATLDPPTPHLAAASPCEVRIVSQARLPVCTVRLPRDADVSLLLHKVARACRLPVASVRLSLRGELLTGGRLSAYALQPSDELMLHVRQSASSLLEGKVKTPAFTFGGAGAEVRLRVHADFSRHERATLGLRAAAHTPVGQLLALAAARVKRPAHELALSWHGRALRNDRSVGWHHLEGDAELQLHTLPLPEWVLPALRTTAERKAAARAEGQQAGERKAARTEGQRAGERKAARAEGQQAGSSLTEAASPGEEKNDADGLPVNGRLEHLAAWTEETAKRARAAERKVRAAERLLREMSAREKKADGERSGGEAVKLVETCAVREARRERAAHARDEAVECKAAGGKEAARRREEVAERHKEQLAAAEAAASARWREEQSRQAEAAQAARAAAVARLEEERRARAERMEAAHARRVEREEWSRAGEATLARRDKEGAGRGEARSRGRKGRDTGGEESDRGGEERDSGGEERDSGGEGRDRGGEGRDRGGEGRDRGGEGRDRGGEGRDRGGEAAARRAAAAAERREEMWSNAREEAEARLEALEARRAARLAAAAEAAEAEAKCRAEAHEAKRQGAAALRAAREEEARQRLEKKRRAGGEAGGEGEEKARASIEGAMLKEARRADAKARRDEAAAARVKEARRTAVATAACAWPRGAVLHSQAERRLEAAIAREEKALHNKARSQAEGQERLHGAARPHPPRRAAAAEAEAEEELLQASGAWRAGEAARGSRNAKRRAAVARALDAAAPPPPAAPPAAPPRRRDEVAAPRTAAWTAAGGEGESLQLKPAERSMRPPPQHAAALGVISEREWSVDELADEESYSEESYREERYREERHGEERYREDCFPEEFSLEEECIPEESHPQALWERCAHGSAHTARQQHDSPNSWSESPVPLMQRHPHAMTWAALGLVPLVTTEAASHHDMRASGRVCYRDADDRERHA